MEVSAGWPDADRLSAEALTLGGGLDVGDGELSPPAPNPAMNLFCTDRRRERSPTSPKPRGWPTRSATPGARAGPAQPGGRPGGHRSGARRRWRARPPGTCAGSVTGTPWRYAIRNLAEALLTLGDWDAAHASAPRPKTPTVWRSVESSPAGGAGSRRYTVTSRPRQVVAGGLEDLPASEDYRTGRRSACVEAGTAVARGQPQAALCHARAMLADVGVLGMSHESVRWAWPLAARAAHDLRDTAAVGELLALLDSHQPGHLAPMLRAERDLSRARLADDDGDSPPEPSPRRSATCAR